MTPRMHYAIYREDEKGKVVTYLDDESQAQAYIKEAHAKQMFALPDEFVEYSYQPVRLDDKILDQLLRIFDDPVFGIAHTEGEERRKKAIEVFAVLTGREYTPDE